MDREKDIGAMIKEWRPEGVVGSKKSFACRDKNGGDHFLERDELHGHFLRKKYATHTHMHTQNLLRILGVCSLQMSGSRS